jgi:diguanylate cyclase (GGDEF)-like protein
MWQFYESLNEGLRISLAADTPDESIVRLIEYAGTIMKSERIYIFEQVSEHQFDCTYEWGTTETGLPKKVFENLSDEQADICLKWLQKKESVIVKEEDVRERNPGLYHYLKQNQISSFVMIPLREHGQIIGFYGMDNPAKEYLEENSSVFEAIGYFIVSILEKRMLAKKLEYLTFYDQMTGCGNRYAMEDYTKNIPKDSSIGLVSGDVTGLKMINDLRGHQAGDQLLIRSAECLKRAFEEYSVFRVGGDEFLVLCEGISKTELKIRVEKLKEDMKENSVVMAIGTVWHSSNEKNLDKLLKEADGRMYIDKVRRYANQFNA